MKIKILLSLGLLLSFSCLLTAQIDFGVSVRTSTGMKAEKQGLKQYNVIKTVFPKKEVFVHMEKELDSLAAFRFALGFAKYKNLFVANEEGPVPGATTTVENSNMIMAFSYERIFKKFSDGSCLVPFISLGTYLYSSSAVELKLNENSTPTSVTNARLKEAVNWANFFQLGMRYRRHIYDFINIEASVDYNNQLRSFYTGNTSFRSGVGVALALHYEFND